MAHHTCTDINAGQGDKHNGKSVAFVEFENGSKLIYKPHSLGTETGFFKLMEWFNSERSDNLLDMKATESADAGDHGWSLIIKCKDAESMQDVNDFYIRAYGKINVSQSNYNLKIT